MEVKVDLSPEQINQTIVEALAKSAIGIELDRIIQEQVKRISSSYQNPIEPIVSRYIADAIQKSIQEKYGAQITDWVTEKVTEKFSEQLFTKMWDSFISKYEIKDIVKEINEQLYGPHDFVQTSPCGAGQHHPHGIVGNLWRIKDPKTVRVGSCFLAGRLKAKDLFLCVGHSGDCFQNYIFVEEYANCLIGKPGWEFGSYGIGDSERVELQNGEFDILKNGGRIERGSLLPTAKTAREIALEEELKNMLFTFDRGLTDGVGRKVCDDARAVLNAVDWFGTRKNK